MICLFDNFHLRKCYNMIDQIIKGKQKKKLKVSHHSMTNPNHIMWSSQNEVLVWETGLLSRRGGRLKQLLKDSLHKKGPFTYDIS